MSPAPAVTPFPGLRTFETTEDEFFFGQNERIEELRERLGRNHFLAVLGVSGCGKSSLVRAGLIPELVGDSANPTWLISIARPQNSPISELARALHNCGLEPEGGLAAIEKTLRETSRKGLLELIQVSNLPSHKRLLVVIDQFEELFRYRRESEEPRREDEAALFVKLLLEAVRDPLSPIYIVITMRSDFLGDCAFFYGLAEAVNEGMYLLPRMTREQCKEAIVLPIGKAEAAITPRLVQRLLSETDEKDDGLPLLQHALRWLWDDAQRRDALRSPIDIPRDIQDSPKGGVAVDTLLNNHLDDIYTHLAPGRQEIARKMFALLGEYDTRGRLIRRPTEWIEVRRTTGTMDNEQELLAVVNEFRDHNRGRTFLTLPSPLDDGSIPTDGKLDLSHETLLRKWARLETWILAESNNSDSFIRLADAADRFALRTGNLLDGLDLAGLVNWNEKFKPDAEWAARYRGRFDRALGRRRRDFPLAIGFLESSKKAAVDKQNADIKKAEEEAAQRQALAEAKERLAEVKAEEAKQRQLAAESKASLAQIQAQKDKQRATYARMGAIIGIVLALGFAGLGWYAWKQKVKAQASAAEARTNEEAAVDLAEARAKETRRAEAATDLAERATQEATAQAVNARSEAERAQRLQLLADANASRAEEQRRIAENEKANAVRTSQQLAAANVRLNDEIAGRQRALDNAEQARMEALAAADQLKKTQGELENRNSEARRKTFVDNLQRVVALGQGLQPEDQIASSLTSLAALVSQDWGDDFEAPAKGLLSSLATALESRFKVKSSSFKTAVESAAMNPTTGEFVGLVKSADSSSVNFVTVDGGGVTKTSEALRTLRFAQRGLATLWAILTFQKRNVGLEQKSFALSANGNTLVQGLTRGYIRVIDRSEGNREQRNQYFRSTRDPITGVAVDSTGQYVVAMNSFPANWVLIDGKRRKNIDIDIAALKDVVLSNIAISENGHWIAAQSTNDVQSWTTDGLYSRFSLPVVGPGTGPMAVNEDGYVAVGRAETLLTSFGSQVKHVFPRTVRSVAFSPSGKLLAACDESLVRVWTFGPQILLELNSIRENLKEVRFTKEDQLITLTDSGSVQLWNLPSTGTSPITRIDQTADLIRIARSWPNVAPKEELTAILGRLDQIADYPVRQQSK